MKKYLLIFIVFILGLTGVSMALTKDVSNKTLQQLAEFAGVPYPTNEAEWKNLLKIYGTYANQLKEAGPSTSNTVNSSEQVKCVFKGATTEQKCYVATSSNDPLYFGCSGTGACVTDVKGPANKALTWKSTCGGYAYTTIDGGNEYATFDCKGKEIIPISPTVTLLSPNGGEVWQPASTQIVTWTSKDIPSKQILIQFFKGDNSVLSSYVPNTGSAKITVPTNIGAGSDFKITVGYKNEAGVFYNDSSDNYFQIGGAVSEKSGNSAPKIVIATVDDETVVPGQIVNFKWKATDANRDNLSWSIDWGDGSGNEGGNSACKQGGSGWSFGSSHAWTQPGAYQVVATVRDCSGATATHVQTITLIVPTVPAEMSLTNKPK